MSFVSTFSSASIRGWVTIGTTSIVQQQKITGPVANANSYFGRSVAIDGAGSRFTALPGYQLPVNPRTYNGSVIYVNNGANWQLEQVLTPTSGYDSVATTSSVSINQAGNVAFVGADSQFTAPSVGGGSVYAFNRTGNSWSQTQQIIASNPHSGDEFGTSLDCDATGNYLIVGAIGWDSNTIATAGTAYVFYNSGSTWTQQVQLFPSDPANSYVFGNSVSINATGEYVAITNTEPGPGTGSVYVFNRVSTTWTQQQKLTANSGNFYNPSSVSLNDNGNVLVIGTAASSNGVSNIAGSAYIFTRTGSTWTQKQQILPNDPAAQDQFGYSVDINSSGDTIIIGAINQDTGNTNAGAAYIFTLDQTTNTYTQTQKIQSSPTEASAFFGYSVATTDTGNIFAVGAPFSDVGAFANAGAVYTFVS